MLKRLRDWWTRPSWAEYLAEHDENVRLKEELEATEAALDDEEAAGMESLDTFKFQCDQIARLEAEASASKDEVYGLNQRLAAARDIIRRKTDNAMLEFERAQAAEEKLRLAEEELRSRDDHIAMLNDPKLMEMELEPGGAIHMGIEPCLGSKILAVSFAKMLDGAPNWRAMEIGPFEGFVENFKGKLMVTVQRADGQSPVELVGELREKLEEAEREVSDANGVMDSIDTTVANALEELGLDTCVGHGFPNRVDKLIGAAKSNVELIGELKDVINELVDTMDPDQATELYWRAHTLANPIDKD